MTITATLFKAYVNNSSIVDQKTPRDRMVQTVRWYLSAFHAGRRSHVAKKPYNPILGEIFKCYYDIPNVSSGKVKHEVCSRSCSRSVTQ